MYVCVNIDCFLDVDVDVDEEPVIFADDECATLTGSDRDDESKASTVEQT